MKNGFICTGVLLVIAAAASFDFTIGLAVIGMLVVNFLYDLLFQAEDKANEKDRRSEEIRVAAMKAEYTRKRDARFKNFMEESW